VDADTRVRPAEERHVSDILGNVTRHRALLLAILMYVTLDLSMPAMPGAFVFAPDDSVESAQGSRGRGSARVVLPLPKDPSVLSGSAIQPTERPRPLIRVAPPKSRAMSSLPRAILGPAPSPPEDPH
jgi:hypothetical protein